MPTDGIVFGEMEMWARIPKLGAECAQSSEERYEMHLAVNHPDWGVGEIGTKIYQTAVVILRDIGNDSMGRKINSRGTTEGECGTIAWNEEEGRNSSHILTGFSHSRKKSCRTYLARTGIAVRNL